MCVWIIVESVFQCLGTDTFCPTSALSLIPGNILGDNTTDDTRKFSGNACVFTCLEMREYSSCLCFIVWFGFSEMVSGDFQQIGHGSNSCSGFIWHSVQSEQTQTSAYLLLLHGTRTLRPAWTWLTVIYQDWRLCSAGKEQCFASELQKILDLN